MKDGHTRIERRAVDEALLAGYPSGIDPLLARVYAARGVAPEELDTGLAAMLPVSSLEGATAAAGRLAEARREGERVLVVGDFDADGATATAVVISCLRAFGFDSPDFLVPDRQRFGYGLSPAVVEVAAERSPDLIVTVDNGIASHAGVARARELGIDVIVTDHHLPGETEPDACVIVNPNARGSRFGSKALAGVGVAFYVMAALAQCLAEEGVLDESAARRAVADTLDFVALGTVADLVPLDRNNRLLVHHGLNRIRGPRPRPGIAALFAAAGRNRADAATGDLGFAIAPRLNAAGRLTDMTVGIHCLLAETAGEAERLASELQRLNQARRQLQAEMQKAAELELDEQLAALGRSHAYCLFQPDWHEGVVGLVATRVKDAVNRPVVAFAPSSESHLLKGSGRSVTGVHLRDVLAAIDARQPGLIERFGGHAMAAGLTLHREKLDPFRDALVAEVTRLAAAIDDRERLWSDGELDGADLTLQRAEAIRHAAPWGQAFPEPLFDGVFEVLQQRVVGTDHLKLRVLSGPGSVPVDAIAFNQPPLPADRAQVRLLYRLDVNEFRERRSAQLVVEHMECV